MLVEANDPSVLSVMGIFQHLSTQELKDLLNDDAKLNFIIKDSSKVKNVEAEKEIVIARNKSLAEFNLAWEPKINEGRQRLISTYEKLASLKNEVEEKEKQSQVKGDSITLDVASTMLQTAATEIEEESERIAERFRDGTCDVEVFIDEFMAKRKLAHLRRVRADKMQELVAKQKQLRPAPPPPTYINQPVNAHLAGHNMYPQPAQPIPSGLPYPIGPPNPSSGLPYPVFPSSSMYPRF